MEKIRDGKTGRFEEDGKVSYYKDGLLHREDGPAVEDPYSGDEWWFDDVQYKSKDDFPGDPVKIVQNEISKFDVQQLEQIADVVQKMISLRCSPEPSDSPKPKI